MSAYLARLKNIDTDNFTNTPCIEPTKPSKGSFVGFVGSLTGILLKIIFIFK